MTYFQADPTFPPYLRMSLSDYESYFALLRWKGNTVFPRDYESRYKNILLCLDGHGSARLNVEFLNLISIRSMQYGCFSRF